MHSHAEVCARCGGTAVVECAQTLTRVSPEERSRLVGWGSERPGIMAELLLELLSDAARC